MDTVKAILSRIECASTKKQKEEEYRTGCISVPHLPEIFEYAYGKDRVFGISGDVVKTLRPNLTGNNGLVDPYAWKTLKNLLDLLVNKKLSGNAASEKIKFLLGTFNSEDKEVIYGIFERNLHCDFTAYTKVHAFECALAKKFEEKYIKEKDTWFISRKLDGVRCIVVNKQYETVVYSRTGKVLSSLNGLAKTVRELFPVGVVLDGEITEQEDGKEDFTGIIKKVTKKDKVAKNITYCIFDIMTGNEFYGLIKSRNLSERIEMLTGFLPEQAHNISHSVTVVALKQTKFTKESFEELKTESAKGEWEGLMLRKDAPYKPGRSSDLLKVKLFNDAEYVVKSAEVTTMDLGKKKGVKALKSVVIMHKGNEVHVGSGFTAEQRIAFAKHPEDIINKVITVKYFEETKNEKGTVSLRFPTLKHIHGDKREV